MPTYEYKCQNDKCSLDIFEKIQGFNDDPQANCPECNSESNRLISAFSVHFKGSGWYSTSNRSSATSPKDSKPESKTENKKKKESKGRKESKGSKESKSVKTSD